MPTSAEWPVEWSAPPSVRAICSTRQGGVSPGPYDSLNLGDHVGDDPDAVQANRARFAQALGVRPVYLRQVHGWRVATLDAGTPDGIEADAAITCTPGVACTVMVADCLPVLLAARDGSVVGAAHAGWRGLAGAQGVGVLEATFQALRSAGWDGHARAPGELCAWLGPCIGPSAFEVGPEVRAVFVADRADAARHFRAGAGDRWLADLAGLARDRLQALGIEAIAGNDGSAPWCTVSNALRFFSHRRDRVSGRFAASVWIGG